MRQIELDNGYMVCVTCKGFIDAENKSPSCECLEGNFDLPETDIQYN